MWKPYMTCQGHVRPAKILKNWKVRLTLLKLPSLLSAVNKSRAGACGRLPCAFGSRACVGPTR